MTRWDLRLVIDGRFACMTGLVTAPVLASLNAPGCDCASEDGISVIGVAIEPSPISIASSSGELISPRDRFRPASEEGIGWTGSIDMSWSLLAIGADVGCGAPFHEPLLKNGFGC